MLSPTLRSTPPWRELKRATLPNGVVTRMDSGTENTRSILVVDDDPMLLQLLKDVLGSEGYVVYLAADGVQGMSMVSETRPDLVLLDIMMPDPDGYLTLDRIRQKSDVPVIIISGRHAPDSLRKAFDLVADDYIGKPFRPKELVARVRAKLRDSPRRSNQN